MPELIACAACLTCFLLGLGIGWAKCLNVMLRRELIAHDSVVRP